MYQNELFVPRRVLHALRCAVVGLRHKVWRDHDAVEPRGRAVESREYILRMLNVRARVFCGDVQTFLTRRLVALPPTLVLQVK